MEVKIFQLSQSNKNAFLFMYWNDVESNFNINRYNVVWECEFEDIVPVPSTNNIWNLDKIYEVFNINHPSGFKGHSLSVSDIVKLGDEYFYCDDLGWENITDKI